MRTNLSRDPFRVGEIDFTNLGIWGRGRGYCDLATRTLRSQTVDPGIRNLVLITAGQSNMTSVASAAHGITNGAALDNLNLYDGAIYAAQDPLLGTQYLYQTFGGDARGSLATRVGDALISAGKFDRVILAPCALGSTLMAQWADGPFDTRVPCILERLRQRGIVEGPNVTFALLWGQGENDNTEGTSQAAYTAAFGRFVARVRAAGMQGRIFIPRQTLINGVTSATIRAAQAACVDNGAGIFAGPDMDAITSGRYPDQTHLDTGAMVSATSVWMTALSASGAPF